MRYPLGDEPRFLADHSFGNLGVLIFFSISGYLIAASWKKDPDLGLFLAKRFRRMAPALAVSVPLTVGAVYAFGLWGFPGNPVNEINGSLWTISFEVYCYMLLAGLAMLTRSFALPFALLMLAVHVPLPRVSGAIGFLTYFGMYFAMGALLFAYPRVLRYWPVLISLGLWLIVTKGDTMLALSLIVPPLVVTVGTRSWPPLNHAGRYGDLSYGVYIYAWPVQQVVIAAIGKDAPYLTLLLPSLAITVGLAYGSWHLVERRALGRLHAVAEGRQSPPAVNPPDAA